MKPSDVSAALRRIASAVENSKNPSRDRVAADLARLARNVRVAATMLGYKCEEGHMFTFSSEDLPSTRDVHTKLRCPLQSCKAKVLEKGESVSTSRLQQDAKSATKGETEKDK
jgi:hypothetical protein